MLGLTGSLNDLNVFTYSYLDDNLPMIKRYHELEKGASSENLDKATNIFNQKLSYSSRRILKRVNTGKIITWLKFVKKLLKINYKKFEINFYKKKRKKYCL